MQKRKSAYLVSIGVVVFLADAAWGMIFSTLSLYAIDLKASVALVGIVVSSIGLSRILGSLPLGVISDRVGRRIVIIMGLVAFLVGSLLLIVAFDPLQLVPVAMLIGLGVSAVFPIGFAYIADFADPARKGEAISVYATFMGAGFSIGPVIGGFTSENWGYTSTYLISSLFFLLSLVIVWKTLKGSKSKSQLNASPGLNDLLKNLICTIKKKETVAISLAMFCYTICFSTIFGFFPLYAEKIGINRILIGSLLTVRTFFSTMVRLPVGILAKKMNSAILMILAIVPSSIILSIIPLFNSYCPLLIILSLEGISFGAFLVSSNVLIAEVYEEHERGTAIGLFTTSQCVALTIGPLILGMIGELWELNALFRVASIMVILGVICLGANKELFNTSKVA